MQKPRKALLVTFDAWKTLFSPKAPIAQQYVEVARQHGVVADEAVIKKSFSEAFTTLSHTHPNYGHTTGLHPDAWWTHLIHQTFSPISLPPTLAPALLSHFASSSAYTLHPSVPYLLHQIRAAAGRGKYDKVILGVISNSDYRVISILRSLGVGNGLIDTVTLSYDVGVEKPHPRMWLVAWNKARAMERNRGLWWDRVHVGDDREKDFEAAKEVRWRAVMWDGGAQDKKRVLGEILGEEEGTEIWRPGMGVQEVGEEKKDMIVGKQTRERSWRSVVDKKEGGGFWKNLETAKEDTEIIDNKEDAEVVDTTEGRGSCKTLETGKVAEEVVSKKKDIIFAKQRKVRSRVSVIEETERTGSWKSWL
ncbi:HAD-like domain-containing protein [Pyronema domesticum]|nr:HAD-like domain-containing protein [Pyronema domesticum]